MTSALRGADGGSSRDMVFEALNSSTDDIAHSLRSNMDRASGYGAVMCFDWQNSPSQGMACRSESDDSLRTSAVPAVLAFDTLNQDDTGSLAHSLRDGHGEGVPVICATGDVTHSLTHEGHDASEDGTGRGTPIVARYLRSDEYAADSVDPTLSARDSRGPQDLVCGAMNGLRSWSAQTATDVPIRSDSQTGIPRRLMPVECERLQAWPDNHTLVPDANGKPLSDAARYKAIGNGVASVHSHWIGWRLALALDGAQ